MLKHFTFTFEQLTQHTEAEICAWMARAGLPELLKSERVQCRERAIGALTLWLALTSPRANASTFAVRAAHSADAARLFERVGQPEQAARMRAAPFAPRGLPAQTARTAAAVRLGQDQLDQLRVEQSSKDVRQISMQIETGAVRGE
ncbi:hypothetical protein WS90_24700 [Burkholderia cepacia]|uniref:Uncharacterized protein n=1 Tax=Burkholderia cepacia TaxID=292 RepID=A0A103ZAK7_BURCE|nr:hypothetical protein [Burkholderia cepacia]KVK76131.1 hypothetical protein WS90_24700 [Burkholderia cepacia]